MAASDAVPTSAPPPPRCTMWRAAAAECEEAPSVDLQHAVPFLARHLQERSSAAPAHAALAKQPSTRPSLARSRRRRPRPPSRPTRRTRAASTCARWRPTRPGRRRSCWRWCPRSPHRRRPAQSRAPCQPDCRCCRPSQGHLAGQIEGLYMARSLARGGVTARQYYRRACRWTQGRRKRNVISTRRGPTQSTSWQPSEQEIALRHGQRLGRLACEQLAVGATRRSRRRPRCWSRVDFNTIDFLEMPPRVFFTGSRRLPTPRRAPARRRERPG